MTNYARSYHFEQADMVRLKIETLGKIQGTINHRQSQNQQR